MSSNFSHKEVWKKKFRKLIGIKITKVHSLFSFLSNGHRRSMKLLCRQSKFLFFVHPTKLRIRNISILVPIVTLNYKMRFHNEFGSLMPNNLNWCAMYSVHILMHLGNSLEAGANDEDLTRLFHKIGHVKNIKKPPSSSSLFFFYKSIIFHFFSKVLKKMSEFYSNFLY